MAINGAEIVEQLRGRMRFYHVGDPVRVDMDKACRAIEQQEPTASSVRGWLLKRTTPELLRELGIKLTPKQRLTLEAAAD